MKRSFSLVLCVLMLLSLAAGCGSAAAPVGSKAELAGGSIEPDATVETEPWFTFQPKVSSVYLDEIFPEAMVQSWYNLVDAVMAGEDTFACPDQETYDWMIHQFPDRCFPLLTEYIEPSFEPVENGIGHICYTVPIEEFQQKLAEFEALVENIINETMRPEYTDLEKALSLYCWFIRTYEYDYGTFEKMDKECPDYIYSYRLLTGGIGICQEISTAYSYLLLEAGVNATIMMGENHQWSYVRINGHNYHIDPTFGLGDYDSLEYFMMSDEKRTEDGFPPEDYVIASAYTQEHETPTYVADDDTFRPLWDAYLDSFDHDTHTICAHTFDDQVNPVPMKFDYSGF